MLLCYSIASLLQRSSVSWNRFGLVFLFVGLLVFSQFHFIFVPSHVPVAYYSFFLPLLSIESLNQFHFNHTYNSTFTVQAITLSYFPLVFLVFIRLYNYFMCECVAFFDSLLCSTLRMGVCVIQQARFLSDMATKKGGGLLFCGQTTILEAIRFEGLLSSSSFWIQQKRLK